MAPLFSSTCAAPPPVQTHPIAFRFPRRDPGPLFFPTMHVHDGSWQPVATFDHLIYAQRRRPAAHPLRRLRGRYGRYPTARPSPPRRRPPPAAARRAAGPAPGAARRVRKCRHGPARSSRELVLRQAGRLVRGRDEAGEDVAVGAARLTRGIERRAVQEAAAGIDQRTAAALVVEVRRGVTEDRSGEHNAVRAAAVVFGAAVDAVFGKAGRPLVAGSAVSGPAT